MEVIDKYYSIKKFLRHRYEIDCEYEIQRKINGGRQIQLYNWWPEDSHSMWLLDFIVKRGLLKDSKKTVALCSVFGEREVLERVDTDIRIFYSGENLHQRHFCHYADYMLSGKRPFNLGIGFDYYENKDYLRFPLWLMYMFKPDSSDDDIRCRCSMLSFPKRNVSAKFAALISRADINGIRSEIYSSLVSIGSISCPSDLFHNDDTLETVFEDNKYSYLKQFNFNICPENSNSYGYVTEKLFEAIEAGCIPIYWGSFNNPESEILNKETIIFWKKDESKMICEKIEKLVNNPLLYAALLTKPRLVLNAEEKVIDYFHILEDLLFRILND